MKKLALILILALITFNLASQSDKELYKKNKKKTIETVKAIEEQIRLFETSNVITVPLIDGMVKKLKDMTVDVPRSHLLTFVQDDLDNPLNLKTFIHKDSVYLAFGELVKRTMTYLRKNEIVVIERERHKINITDIKTDYSFLLLFELHYMDPCENHQNIVRIKVRVTNGEITTFSFDSQLDVFYVYGFDEDGEPLRRSIFENEYDSFPPGYGYCRLNLIHEHYKKSQH